MILALSSHSKAKDEVGPQLVESINESLFLTRMSEYASCIIPINMENFEFKRKEYISSYENESTYLQSSIIGISAYSNIIHSLSSKLGANCASAKSKNSVSTMPIAV
jgi:hypothetical protein